MMVGEGGRNVSFSMVSISLIGLLALIVKTRDTQLLESRVIKFVAYLRDSIPWRQFG